MKKSSTLFRGLISVLLFAACLFSVTGCQEPQPELTGTYTSSFGETYIITDTTFTYSSSMEYDGVKYETIINGTDVVFVSLSDTAGYIYYKVQDVDQWAATAYKDLVLTGVSLSNAYKLGGKTYCDTLQEAKTEFTIENGYFAYFGEYAKK